MRTLALALAAWLTLVAGNAGAQVDLFDWALNLDGVTFCKFDTSGCDNEPVLPAALPVAVDAGGFDFVTGLGRIDIFFGVPGPHQVDLFLDHDLGSNLSDESAVTVGVVSAGQTWEVDEPGFGAGVNGTGGQAYVGDIFSNLLASTLDSQIFFDAVDAQSLAPPISDVSMALGWDFVLGAGERAVASFFASLSRPTGGEFLLTQSDGVEQTGVFFSSRLSILPTPEPGTWGLLGLGLIGLALKRRGRRSA